MKAIDKIIKDCEGKRIYWTAAAHDNTALVDLGKTKHEAECLAQYFDGVCDGLIEAKRLVGFRREK